MGDSIAVRLAKVDAAAAKADVSAATYEVLRTQLEAARLVMKADIAALEAARRAVVDGLLIVGMPTLVPGANGVRFVVQPYRGGYLRMPVGDGMAQIEEGGPAAPWVIVRSIGLDKATPGH